MQTRQLMLSMINQNHLKHVEMVFSASLFKDEAQEFIVISKYSLKDSGHNYGLGISELKGI